MNNSYFDGGLFGLIVISIVGFLITFLSFGILYPWAIVLYLKWMADHTVIEGQRLCFDGSAISLFAQWIKWFLLIIITFGIYGFWVSIALQKWKIRHTHFA